MKVFTLAIVMFGTHLPAQEHASTGGEDDAWMDLERARELAITGRKGIILQFLVDQDGKSLSGQWKDVDGSATNRVLEHSEYVRDNFLLVKVKDKETVEWYISKTFTAPYGCSYGFIDPFCNGLATETIYPSTGVTACKAAGAGIESILEKVRSIYRDREPRYEQDLSAALMKAKSQSKVPSRILTIAFVTSDRDKSATEKAIRAVSSKYLVAFGARLQFVKIESIQANIEEIRRVGVGPGGIAIIRGATMSGRARAVRRFKAAPDPFVFAKAVKEELDALEMDIKRAWAKVPHGPDCPKCMCGYCIHQKHKHNE